MNKGRKASSKRSASKTTPPDGGVCGSGRSRVININPLLLTPSSAAKFYSPEQKKHRHDQKTRQKLPGRPEATSSLQLLPRQNDVKVSSRPEDDLSSFPGYFNSHPNGYHHSRLSKSTSMTGSELSLSSTLTTDDISSIADSEITDTSESAMNLQSSYDYASDMTLQANPLPLNSAWSTDVRSEPGSLHPCGIETSFPSVSPSHKEGFQENFGHAKDIPRNQELHSRPRLERTIEISPTLMLPVTSVGRRRAISPREELVTSDLSVAMPEDSLDDSRTSEEDMSSTAPSEQADGSMQSSFSTVDGNGITNEENDGNVQSSAENIFSDSLVVDELQTECTDLRQSLKLADADIAILVSSKQQLQLKFHEEKEKNGALAKKLFAAEEKSLEYKEKLDDMEKSLKEQEEVYEIRMSDHAEEILNLKRNLETVRETLDVTRAERDSGKAEVSNLMQSTENYKMQIKQMKRELEDATATHMRLETLVQEASSKGEGNQAYIAHLKEERTELTVKIQELEQQNTTLVIKNKSQESKLVDLQHANKETSDKVIKYEARSRETESENAALVSRLQAATTEKTQLNAAVARLRSDLSKVETSFSRLKQQMIEKSRQAEMESTRRGQLERELKILSHQVDRLSNVDAETRLRDKNVQIEQLLTKSRISTSEKTRMEKSVERLQVQLASAEKSWAEAVEKEKLSSRLLSEKEKLHGQRLKECEDLRHRLSLKTKEMDSLQQSLEESESSGMEVNKKLVDAEQKIEKLLEENSSISASMEQLRRQLHENGVKSLEDERRHKEMVARMQNDVMSLNTQVEDLQLSLLSKEEELKIHNDIQPDTSVHEPDPHMIQQMEMLSELQAARRELSKEKDRLLGENTELKAEVQNLVREIEHEQLKLSEVELNEKKNVEIMVKEIDDLKQMMKSKIEEEKEKLIEAEKLKAHLEEEMSIVKDHNNVLSQQLGALQTHGHKLSDDLQLKTKELEESGSQQIRMQEEMGILKQELSNVTFQLSEALQANSQLNRTGDMENVMKERDLLKDAVMRQQQYVASLQKHYESWAKDASAQMKEEVAKIRIAAEEERNSLCLEKIEHANMLQAMEKVAKEKLVVKHAVDVNTRSESERTLHAASMKDSSSQTEHSLEPLIPWSQKFDEALLLKEEMVALKRGLDAKLKDALKQNEHVPFMDVEVLMNERELLRDVVLRQQKYTVSMQDHYDKWARGASEKMKEEVKNVHAAAFQEKLDFKAENCALAEVIATLEEKMEELTSVATCETIDVDTQTSHDDIPFAAHCDFHKTEQAFLEDSSTQTNHDQEAVGRLDQVEERTVDKETVQLQKSTAEIQRILELEAELKNLRASQSQELADAMTQTSHYDTPLYLHSRITPPMEVSSTLLEDSSTQTDHDEDTLNAHTEDWEKMADELTTVRVVAEKEKAHLLQENMDLMCIITDLKKTITAEKPLTDSCTQTSKDFEELQTNILFTNPVEDVSTQTEHDDEPITPMSPVYHDFSKEMSLRITAEEEKALFEERNIQLTEQIVTLEKKLKTCTSEDRQMLDHGTQTSHDNAPLNTSFGMDTLPQLATIIEDSSTQTEHELDPCLQQGESERLRIIKEERDSFLLENRKQVRRIEELKKVIQGFAANDQGRRDADTQTAHEDTPLDLLSEMHKPKLTLEAGTQYEHSDQLILPWSQEADDKIKEEICMVRKLAEEEMLRLLDEKEAQADEITSLKEKVAVLASRKCRTGNAATQTSHEDRELHTLAIADHSVVCNEKQRTDSWTQTAHDVDPVVPLSQECLTAQLKEELDFSKQELSNVYCQLSDALEENKRLANTLRAPEAGRAIGTQTTHDEDLICLHSGLMETVEVATDESSTQTPNMVHPPVAMHTTTKEACVQTADIGEMPLIRTKDEPPVRCQSCNACVELSSLKRPVRIVPNLSDVGSQQPSESVESKTNISTTDDGACPMCGHGSESSIEGFDQLPSPMTILKTMESRKLKAYKKTVHLLKKKLQTAENKISDLQAELNMMTPTRPERIADEELPERQKRNDEQELYEQNRRAMLEIKQLQNEIYEAKKSSALQAEDRRRKALADRKKLEAKIVNMSDRISGLTETNKRLRDSVEKLQVRLAEKAKSADIAQKEKQRYQLRARRLQASLRSLAWITGKPNNLEVTADDSEIMLEEDSSVLEDSLEVDQTAAAGDVSKEYEKPLKKPILDRSVLSLPASVTEIEESLRDLQSEIIALEKQMQEHNSAVKRSKSHWTKLKEESHQDLNLLNEDKENIESTSSSDHIDKISHII